MCVNCSSGISGVREDGPVFCGDCAEGVQLEIQRLRDRAAKFEQTLARYDGSETGWRAQYRASLEAARETHLDRIDALEDRLRRLQGDELTATGKVRPLGMRQYAVGDAGELRFVVDLAAVECGCPAFEGGAVCEHLYAAMAYEKADFVTRALAHRERLTFAQIVDEMGGVEAATTTWATYQHCRQVAHVASTLA